MTMQKEKEVLLNSTPLSPIESINDPPPTYTPRSYDPTSTTAVNLQSPVPQLIEAPSRILSVQARGTGWCRCPTASTEMEIGIFDNTPNTTTTGEPLYVSTRHKRSSGSAVLTHAHEGDVLTTTYKFGPGRDPKIRYVNPNAATYGTDVKVMPGYGDDSAGPTAVEVNTATWSYNVTLTAPSNPTQSYKWKYIRTSTPTDKRLRVLALVAEQATSSSSSSKRDDGADGKVLAVLVRSEGARTPGTHKWDAGNGGELVFAPEATRSLEESVIVASCLMMLKREVDRQRAAQIAVIATAASAH